MSHLVTIASDECGGRNRWVPTENGNDVHVDPRRHDSPHGLEISRPRLGAIYLFTCTTCPHRPVNGETQS